MTERRLGLEGSAGVGEPILSRSVCGLATLCCSPPSGLESRHLESTAKAGARLDLEVSCSVGESILSRPCGGAAAVGPVSLARHSVNCELRLSRSLASCSVGQPQPQIGWVDPACNPPLMLLHGGAQSDLKAKMMGLEKDPRVVLQVLTPGYPTHSICRIRHEKDITSSLRSATLPPPREPTHRCARRAGVCVQLTRIHQAPGQSPTFASHRRVITSPRSVRRKHTVEEVYDPQGENGEQRSTGGQQANAPTLCLVLPSRGEVWAGWRLHTPGQVPPAAPRLLTNTRRRELQVLGVKVDGHPPTNEQLAAGYKRALVQCHPDRLKARGGGDSGGDASSAHAELYCELMAEETFKLVTCHPNPDRNQTLTLMHTLERSSCAAYLTVGTRAPLQV